MLGGFGGGGLFWCWIRGVGKGWLLEGWWWWCSGWPFWGMDSVRPCKRAFRGWLLCGGCLSVGRWKSGGAGFSVGLCALVRRSQRAVLQSQARVGVKRGVMSAVWGNVLRACPGAEHVEKGGKERGAGPGPGVTHPPPLTRGYNVACGRCFRHRTCLAPKTSELDSTGQLQPQVVARLETSLGWAEHSAVSLLLGIGPPSCSPAALIACCRSIQLPLLGLSCAGWRDSKVDVLLPDKL